jgi:hypothetical protein
MARKQGRFYRPKSKSLIGSGYDSFLEKRLDEGPLKDFEFHTKKIPYYIEHTYNPDFTYTCDDGVEFLVEAKAFFQDSAEASKYKWIRDQIADNQILIFVLEDPKKAIHWQSKRKDGTKMTMSEWCDRQKIMWVAEDEAGNIIKGGS